ncbi:hypothetical protein Q9L58_006986 [Maublancomyces gigas]|uniref:Uncharacterized protein n=1 Tax=Discina gigas TaxID=1032678 RepID=A0ABR3GEG0_9PEZI
MSHQSAPVSFTERVYTLSNLIHTAKTPITNPSNHPAHQRKNLRLLDNIALLLLTQPSPDVAAVALERHTTQAIFYYTKLHSSTATEQAYIHDLITTLQGPTNKNNYQIIISKVVKACRPKILSRLTKLKTAILTAAPRSLNIDTDSVVHRYFEKQLGSWYTGYESPQQFMERYLSHIRLLVPNERDDLELQQIIRVAHITSSYIPSTTVFPNTEIAKRVGRVGEWYGAVTRVVNAARAIKRHGVEIVFIQVGYVAALWRLATDMIAC